jgi:mobilization protein NikA
MADRRTAAKLIRFHPDELREITECARRSGLTPARFIRETALGATPKARVHAADQPLLHELARLGRCLDRLARLARANRDTAFVGPMGAALERHQAIVRHVVHGRRQKGGSSP